MVRLLKMPYRDAVSPSRIAMSMSLAILSCCGSRRLSQEDIMRRILLTLALLTGCQHLVHPDGHQG